MTAILSGFLDVVSIFFLLYLLLYATYLFLSVTVGAWRLYKRDKMRSIKNELKHEFYFPISVLVPAYNEEVTILDNVESMLNLDYQLYEIIVVDDGSTDDTTKILVEHFDMIQVQRPIKRMVSCQPVEAVYETRVNGIQLTVIKKKNGGKGDALNMGINAAQFPYFVCIDADSMLQRDSLARIIQPVMEDDSVVAVGGLIRVAQCVEMEEGKVESYHLPWNPLTCMQVMEYDRSFLASRILLDNFNGNLIISGAFGLFKKDIVVAAGGYAGNTLGEDMELVLKLHAFCRQSQIPYSIRYEPNAVCWSQAPSSMKDFRSQRRRWHLGLFQCMMKYRSMFMKPHYGLVGSLSYLYYLLYELFTPQIEIFGLFATILAAFAGMLNIPFMLRFYALYALYGAILTITAFFQRIYTQNLKIGFNDVVKACVACVIENFFFRFYVDLIRGTAFLGYRKYKNQWGKIKRSNLNKDKK